MKTGQCSYTESRIYPGRGQKFVANDGKVSHFITRKAKSLFFQRIKQVKLRWTQAWRRMNKKGKADEQSKKRGRKVQPFQKAIVAMSLDDIRKKKAQKPELRQQARDDAAKEARARMAKKQRGRARMAYEAQSKPVAIRRVRKGNPLRGDIQHFQLKILRLNGDSQCIRVHNNMTIREVKSEIGKPHSKLAFGLVALNDDEQTLQQAGISEGDSLNIWVQRPVRMRANIQAIGYNAYSASGKPLEEYIIDIIADLTHRGQEMGWCPDEDHKIFNMEGFQLRLSELTVDCLPVAIHYGFHPRYVPVAIHCLPVE